VFLYITAINEIKYDPSIEGFDEWTLIEFYEVRRDMKEGSEEL
jgi:hypothetical protein